jgi:hypothetical protein
LWIQVIQVYSGAASAILKSLMRQQSGGDVLSQVVSITAREYDDAIGCWLQG